MIRPVLTTLPHEPAHTTTRSTALPRYAAMHPKPLFTFPTLLLRTNNPKGYWTESSDLSQNGYKKSLRLWPSVASCGRLSKHG